MPVDPPVSASAPVRLAVKPAPGQSEVTLYLAAQETTREAASGIVWQRPRFESAGKPALLLSDYDKFGPAFEVEYPALFVKTEKYLAAAVELANDRKLTAEDAAKKPQ